MNAGLVLQLLQMNPGMQKAAEKAARITALHLQLVHSAPLAPQKPPVLGGIQPRPPVFANPAAGIRVIYGHSHIYLNLGICLGCKIQVSDLASFVDVIDVHVYFWCHPLFLIFYHIA